jgi:hypothetical protein
MTCHPREEARKAVAKELDRVHRRHLAERAREVSQLRRLIHGLGERQLDSHFSYPRSPHLAEQGRWRSTMELFCLPPMFCGSKRHRCSDSSR